MLDKVRSGRSLATIRGAPLDLDRLIDPDVFLPGAAEKLRADLLVAKPYEHLVLDGLFDETLLDLVHEEFDTFGANALRPSAGSHEKNYRSAPSCELGPATQLYFAILNSGRFIDLLSRITGIDGLVADGTLRSGGLHETRAGGRFDVHLDYDVDDRTRLPNRMVFITYLNRDWEPSYGGDLELWDANGCAAKVAPVFGRSLLLPHTERSYHGHPDPLTPPPGRSRRSVAAYYYALDVVGDLPNCAKRSRFLSERDSRFSGAQLKDMLQWVTPPILWRSARALRDRRRR